MSPVRLSRAALDQLAAPFPPDQAKRMSEQEFQGLVVDLATRLGWWSYHPFDSRRSQKGWPDLTLIRAPRMVFLELKSQRGRERPEQADVRARIASCWHEVHLFRPADWPTIVHLLNREA